MNVLWGIAGRFGAFGGQYGNWLTNPLAAAQDALE